MINEDKIDVLQLSRIIWDSRVFIIKVTVVFVVLGLIIAFTSKEEFKTSCKLLPESLESGPDFGGLGGLAGLAGFDLSSLSSQGALSPELYPEIVKSTPFINNLINTPVYFEKKDTTVSSFLYFKEIDKPSLLGLMAEYTIGLPGKAKQLFFSTKKIESNSDNDLIRFSKEDWEIFEKFKERLSVDINEETGTIQVTTEMPDPVAAAKITDIVVKELTERITRYKTEQTQVNLEFVRERFAEVKKEYEDKQTQLARFSDRNRNITNSIIQTEYERLQNELDIAFDIYKGIASQLEQLKIKIKEETPVFAILEPVKVPVEKSKPKRMIMLFISLFLGGIVGIAFTLFRITFINVQE